MAGSSDAAPPPAFPTPPDLRAPTGDVSVWFTRPDGAVLQLSRPTYVTAAHVAWMLDCAEIDLARRYPGDHRRIIVLDLSQMIARAPDARTLLLTRAPDIGKRLRCAYLIAPLSMSRLQALSLQAVSTLLRGFSVRVELRRLFEDVRREEHLTAALSAG